MVRIFDDGKHLIGTLGPWWEGVIRVVGGEIGNLVPWGGVSPHCVGGRE